MDSSHVVSIHDAVETSGDEGLRPIRGENAMLGYRQSAKSPERQGGILHPVTAGAIPHFRFDDMGGGDGRVGPEPDTGTSGERELGLASGDGETAFRRIPLIELILIIPCEPVVSVRTHISYLIADFLLVEGFRLDGMMREFGLVREYESAYCIRIRKKFEHVRRIQMESQRHPTTGVLIVGKQVFEKGRRRFSGSFPGSGQTEAYRRAFLGIIVE